MRTFPDLSDPRSIRNMAVATLVPGTAAYLLSRYFLKAMAEYEGKEFEKMAMEAAKGENPVMSVDPHLGDSSDEETLNTMGVRKTSSAVTSTAKAASAAWRALKAHPVIPSVVGAGGSMYGGKKLWNHLRDKGNAFTGDLEPGLLLAAAYLAGIGGLSMGKAAQARQAVKDLRKKVPKAMNELEKSEYDRLFLLNDPEGYETYLSELKKDQKKAEKIAEKSVTKTAYTEADMIDSMVWMIQHRAGVEKNTLARKLLALALRSGRKLTPGGLAKTIGGLGLTGAAAYGVNALRGPVGLLQQMYPLIFATLLLGGAGAGKAIADAKDINRVHKKALKKYLARDLLENQSPAILDVGSPLPWEAARHGGARQAAKGELPEDALLAEAKAAQEIRI